MRTCVIASAASKVRPALSAPVACKRIDRLFGQLKHNMGLRRLELRGLRGGAEEFTMAAAAQNPILLTRKQTAA